ncbi:MAG: hypothetical protein OXR73_23260 [Myxococcales bacterium]|nr:hypothetical protein [Myxococcales bacterium]
MTAIGGLAVLTSQAAAQRAPSLGWVRMPGAEACISTRALAERVERRLQRDVFVSASQSELAVEGRVAPGDGPNSWVATLVMSDPDGRVLGQRELRAEGQRCAVLDESLTLVIAIAIDPGSGLGSTVGAAATGTQGGDPGALSDGTERLIEQLGLTETDEQTLIAELTLTGPDTPGSQPAASGDPEGNLKTRPSPEAARPPSRRSTDRKSDEIQLSASGGALMGALPRPAATLSASLSIVSTSFWALDLGLELALPQTQLTNVGTATFSLFAAQASLCPVRPQLGALALRLCVGSRLGILFAEGENFERNETPAGTWAELLGAAKFIYYFKKWFVQAEGTAGTAFVRDRFLFRGRDNDLAFLHRASALIGRASIGLGVRF